MADITLWALVWLLAGLALGVLVGKAIKRADDEHARPYVPVEIKSIDDLNFHYWERELQDGETA